MEKEHNKLPKESPIPPPDNKPSYSRFKRYLLALGPGLLMAGAAIGGSHLIQSTRAGAEYSLSLIWVIILAILFKYAAFEAGPRYTVATKENLLKGYLRLGKWAFYIFFVFTFLSMFIITATLLLVTGGLASNTLPLNISNFSWCLITGIIITTILIIGRYPFLDKIIKIAMTLMCVITVLAVILLIPKTNLQTAISFPQTYWNKGGVLFIVALMGWMPSIVDISVWESLWSVARWKQTSYQPTLKEALFDFKLGYFSTTIMAFVFVALGALLMYGGHHTFSNVGKIFADQLVELYTNAIGMWSYAIISFGIFIVMFSTSLAATDAYSRVITNCIDLIGKNFTEKAKSKLYISCVILIVAGALLIIRYVGGDIKTMVDFSTTLSFLMTPVLAYLNYKIIFMPIVAKEHQPGKFLKILTIVSLIFWTLFALFYLGLIFF